MLVAIIIYQVLMCFFAFVTLFRVDHWVVRLFDFPKVQLLLLSLLGLFLGILYFNFGDIFQWIGISMVVLAISFHCIKIIPYSGFFRKEVLRTTPTKSSRCLSLMASNVLTPNDHYEKLLGRIQTYKPDLLLTLESDLKWEKALQSIESDYPFTVKIPKDNLYGMHLYSKYELEEVKINHFLKDEIPSIEAYVRIDDEQKVKIFALHPKPPSPTEAKTSTNRDAELLIVAKLVKEIEEPVVVFGDLNDVAWSRSTQLFRKISGLLDPRIGRGRYSTFHAQYAFLRWPLDHLFHSKDFSLNEIRVLPDIGSDHFPIYAKLELTRLAEKHQEEHEADTEEKEQANEKIEKAFQKTSPLSKIKNETDVAV
ncbi:endonuclease/exonuclease/phosphatase family protein [Psychroflexus montanilacus]|uniref:endonuclease/exonuclease/phosphatase family protein n=1 Tax=Psychroflexus montanilacus TaxID=2873598 RepID=UPI001CD030FB|nr:endonuclease/exonuclease/phosphatase family protein [Psychroflexus montanilacus]MBZ9650638.1 endonuclease/exonuclease/phosphatase family protein [Psychroflexus montanilacus]